jgi:hypothetical protein
MAGRADAQILPPRPATPPRSAGSPALPATTAGDAQASPQETPDILRELLEAILYQAIPREYHSDRKWGTTKEVFDGWHVRAKGWKIYTKRKKKRVKHGTWKRYEIKLVEPQEHLRLQWTDLPTQQPGETRGTLLIQARLDVIGELQEWHRDVRFLGISGEATADVTLNITGRVTTRLDASRVPADIVLDPMVEQASLEMTSFKLKRLGKADGPFIRELGDGFEPVLEELIEQQNGRLTDKINRQIEKKKERLRLSATDAWVRVWTNWLGD